MRVSRMESVGVRWSLPQALKNTQDVPNLSTSLICFAWPEVQDSPYTASHKIVTQGKSGRAGHYYPLYLYCGLPAMEQVQIHCVQLKDSNQTPNRKAVRWEKWSRHSLRAPAKRGSSGQGRLLVASEKGTSREMP